MPRWHKTFLLAVIYLCFLGCAKTTPILMDLVYEKTVRKDGRSAVSINQQCSVHIASIVDGRSNKDTIGVVDNAPVISDRITDWVSKGLLDLENYGYQLSDKELPPDTATQVLSVDVTIIRVFIHQNPIRLHGAVILQASFRSNKGVLGERLYRGDGDRFNWANGKGELLDVLNRALSNTISNIATDLKEMCGF